MQLYAYFRCSLRKLLILQSVKCFHETKIGVHGIAHRNRVAVTSVSLLSNPHCHCTQANTQRTSEEVNPLGFPG